MFKYRLGEVDRWWHDAGYPVWGCNTERSEEETRAIFVGWKAEYDKVYSSRFYGESRYAVFKDGLHDVDRHNAEYAVGVHPGTQGIDGFADLTMEEFEAVYCGYWPHDYPRPEAELIRVAEIQEQLRRERAPHST